MGRKRNQGKARRAAKAKAREEEEAGERGYINQAANSSEQSSSLALQGQMLCTHGFDPVVSTNNFPAGQKFVAKFRSSFIEATVDELSECFEAAVNATMDEFADVWKDLTKLEIAVSCCLCMGTKALILGQDRIARDLATFARFFEQLIATELKHTQALYNWPKVDEMYIADDHTLVKFYRHRIPCSCLDKKYEEVKHITKMAFCWNSQCSILSRKMERSRTKYCSRCRCVVYCSRACQVADWSRHKPCCDSGAAVIAKFEANRQRTKNL